MSKNTRAQHYRHQEEVGVHKKVFKKRKTRKNEQKRSIG